MKADLDVLKSTSRGRNRNVPGIRPARFVHPLSLHSSDLPRPDRLTFIFLSKCNTCSSFRVNHRGNVSKTALVVSLQQAGLLFIVQQYEVQNRTKPLKSLICFQGFFSLSCSDHHWTQKRVLALYFRLFSVICFRWFGLEVNN